VVIRFSECATLEGQQSGCPVHSSGQPSGSIVTTTLRGSLGVVSGLVLLPNVGKRVATLAGSECTPESIVTGSIAGVVSPSGSSQATSKLTIGTSGGRQEVESVAVLGGRIATGLTVFGTAATEEAEESIAWSKAVELT
jgi:hypothetical protein